MTTDTGRTTAPPEAATPQGAGGNRRLDIQGLRAIAVLMVVAFHAELPAPGGFVGVDVFFVISGFVITAMLMREWTAQGRIRLGQFYVRRFKRLTPALALMLCATMIIGFFVLSPLGTQQDASRTAIGAMLLAANLVIAKLTGDYFDLEADTNALLNTWSLSVEEQFYLLFPTLLLVGWLLTRRTGRTSHIGPVALVTSVGGVSFGLAMLGASGYVPPAEGWLLGFYSPLTRVWEFAVGALLALAGERARLTSRSAADAACALGAAMLAASLLLISGATTFPGPATLLPVVGSLLLLLAGTHPDGAARRVLSTTPMVTIGDWSYSIYLWHWPLIVFATLLWPHQSWAAPAAAALSFLPAGASYRWVETPLRTRPTRTLRELLTFVLATVVPAFMLSIGLWQASEHAFWQPQVRDFQQAVFAQPCSGNADDCAWDEDATGPPVYIFGDSNAGHFVEAVIAAGDQLDRPVLAETTNSCPFVDVSLDRLDKPTSWDTMCRDFVQGRLDYLRTEAAPGTVIVSNIDGYWDEGGYAIGASPEMRSTESAAKIAALEEGLTSMVESLRRAGHRVVIVQTIPRWVGEDTWKTASCNVARIVADGCEQSMPVERALERQGAVRAAIEAVAQQTEATVFDPWPILCPDSVCSTNSPEGDPRYYRDGLHVSVRQGRELAPDFVTVLTETAPA